MTFAIPAWDTPDHLVPRPVEVVPPEEAEDHHPGEPPGCLRQVVAKAIELRERGLTHLEVCDELNLQGFRTRTGKEWGHAQQIIKLLRSFGGQA